MAQMSRSTTARTVAKIISYFLILPERLRQEKSHSLKFLSSDPTINGEGRWKLYKRLRWTPLFGQSRGLLKVH